MEQNVQNQTFQNQTVVSIDNSPITIQRIIDALDDKRAADIKVLDLTCISETLEYFIVATGESSLQLRAMQDNVKDELKSVGILPKAVEGPSERWLLMDYGDTVVHLMSPKAREFYDLEGLWADAEVLPVKPTPLVQVPNPLLQAVIVE